MIFWRAIRGDRDGGRLLLDGGGRLAEPKHKQNE